MAPLRAWDDFFPGSDRFALPDLKDISKWNNRVVSNLLYYQTNYLMVAAALVSIVGSVRPRGAAGPGPGPAGQGGVAPLRGRGICDPARCHGKGPGHPREGCDSTGRGELPFPFFLFPSFPLTLFHSPFPLPPLLKHLVSFKNVARFTACLGGGTRVCGVFVGCDGPCLLSPFPTGCSSSPVPRGLRTPRLAEGSDARSAGCRCSRKAEPHPAQRAVLPPELPGGAAQAETRSALNLEKKKKKQSIDKFCSLLLFRASRSYF